MTRQIAEELGVDFREVGELIVVFDSSGMDRLLKIKEDAELLGVPGLEIVGSGWLRENEPNLSEEVIAALYAPTAGIISPYRLAYDLSENAARNGVKIYTETEVTAIKRCNGDIGFVVETTAGEYSADYVINCGGLFADDISRMVGVDDFKIHPRKGQEFLLDKKMQNITEHLIFPLPTETSKGTLVIKTADGNPMIGPTAEEVEDKYDLSTSDEGLNTVLGAVKRMVPAISSNDIITYFAGLRPAAGKDFIIRHELSSPGFINVAGIQSPGLTAAPAIAVYVKALLKESGLNMRKKSEFIEERKKTVHLFDVPLEETKELINEDPEYGDIVCRCEMVSAKEIKEAIKRGAKTLDGIKFRTRAQAGRCHGGFCTTRLLKFLSKEQNTPITKITKRGPGSEIITQTRPDAQAGPAQAV